MAKKRIQYRYDAIGNRIGMTDPDGGQGDCAMMGNLRYLANRLSCEVDGQLCVSSRGVQGGPRCWEMHRRQRRLKHTLAS
jgi:hypothetical protein